MLTNSTIKKNNLVDQKLIRIDKKIIFYGKELNNIYNVW